jgi:dTDP-4-dehydrorhamnose reductase
MIILVTGANGQLGSEIRYLSSYSDHSFIFCDIEEMDLSNRESILDFLEANKPDFIISCGAYTAVDKAEEEPELVHKINAVAPQVIAEFCKSNKIRLIHISTDYVFDGEFNRPITEGDKPNPQSVYGRTKLEGETNVIALLMNAYIIRTSWVYSTFGNNFAKTMLRLGGERDEINVVNDQIGTPTYARDLGKVILTIIDQIQSGNDQPGVYHFSNEGVCSWYDFAVEIMRKSNSKCKVNPIPSVQFPTKAKRPTFSVLDKSKLKKTFAIKNSHWTMSSNDCIKLLLQ